MMKGGTAMKKKLKIFSCLGLGCISVLISLNSYSQNPWLIKDINTTSVINQLSDGTYIGQTGSTLSAANSPSSANQDEGPVKMYPVNGMALFFANDGKGARGLWKTDGTFAGTSLVSTLGLPPSEILYVEDSYVANNLLYFTQFDPNADPSLVSIWRSDGTPGGTYQLFSGPNRDGPRVPGSSNLGAQIGNNFYFIAAEKNPNKDSIYTNVYKTDGTVAGTTIYYPLDSTAGNFNSNGDITNYAFSINVNYNIVGFSNKIYFNYRPNAGPFANKGTQIWNGDGITKPQILPAAPGFTDVSVGDWFNVNNQYLIINAYTSNGPPQLLRLYPADTAPVGIGDGAGINFFPDGDGHAAITGNKIFYIKNRDSAFVTNGEASGTFGIGLNKSIYYFNGIGSYGIISNADSSFNTEVYIWDGNSPSSYKLLSAYTDSSQLYDRGFGSLGALFFGDTLLIFAGSHLFQTDVNNSYCYAVENFGLNDYLTPSGTILNNSYVGFSNGGFGGVFNFGQEPFSIRPFQNIWTGNTSSDWNTSTNWLGLKVPSSSDDVVIPRTKNQPVVNTSSNCRNLTVNFASLTINKPGTLNIGGYVANYGLFGTFATPPGNISGTGSITRSGSYSNKTYGGGVYNIDTININGADLDLTSIYNSVPNIFEVNSIINFQSDNKLIMNYTSLYINKRPYFTGYNNNRFVVNNRIFSLGNANPNTCNIGTQQNDSLIVIPIGTNINSYTPLTISTHYPPIYRAGLFIFDSASYHGFNNLFSGVVKKTWESGLQSYDTIKLGWSAADEGPGFNRNACFIAYFNGTSWVQGNSQTAQLNNGTYSISDFILNPTGSADNYGYYPLMVASRPCIASAISKQPSDTTVCAGNRLLMTVLATNSPAYQWQVNNGSGWVNATNGPGYTGAASDSLVITNPTTALNNYQYQCLVTSSCNTITSSSATLKINPSAEVAVNIRADTTNICKGMAVSFTAMASNGGTSPAYQWLINGTDVGTGGASFTTTTLKNSDVVSCVMTSNSACVVSPTATSNSITMTVAANAAAPSVSITSSAANICADSAVTFTATPVNGGSNPVFLWRINGVNKAVTNSFISFPQLKDGDVVNCVMTGNSSCAVVDTALSNSITISVSTPVTPSVTITASAVTICPGAQVNFAAKSVNGGPGPVYQWLVNGAAAGSAGPAFTTSSLSDGDVVSCVMTSDFGCVLPGPATSNAITMAVSAIVPSTLSISASANGICADSMVVFTAAAINGGSTPSYHWQLNGNNVGTNSAEYSNNQLNNGDVVNCQLTGSGGTCTPGVSVASPITMTVYPRPSVSPGIPVTINQGNSVQLTPSVTGSVGSYQWSPAAGLSATDIRNPRASPSSTTAYLLTVVSLNGCTDTASFIVNVLDELDIPNAFSPNGDGINDFWQIPYLINLPSCTVDVYNRYGQLLFHTVGYGRPWDGTSNGNPLPLGTYYYIIDPKNGHKRMAGSVTILK
jgi:gliding motility-associated-like protein